MKHKIAYLDTFRGLSAITVLIAHAYATFIMPFVNLGELQNIVSLLSGWAVIAFFILSGYLITSSVLFNKKKNGYFVWQTYLLSRVARIYPPLIAAIVLCVLIFLMANYFNLHGAQSFRLDGDKFLLRESFEFRPYEIVYSLTMRGGMLPMDGPLWSLYIEFKIYILVMFIAVLLAGNLSIAWKGGVFLMGMILLVDLADSFAFVAIWMVGSGVALVHKIDMKPEYLKSIYMCGLLVFSFCFLIDQDLFLQQNIFSNKGFLAQLSFSVVLAAIMLDWQPGRRYVVLFSGTAKYSYTLYIIHFPLLLLMFSGVHEFMADNHHSYGYLVLILMLACIMIVFVASIMARYVESKIYFEGLIRKLLVKFHIKNSTL